MSKLRDLGGQTYRQTDTKTMLGSICDDEYASTSTNKIYIIDVPDKLEMIDTQDPDLIRNTE